MDELRKETGAPEAHSFIIKLWFDDPLDGSGCRQWRGHITHVPSGTRRYLKTLDDALIFIRSFLGSTPSVDQLPQKGGRWVRSTERFLRYLWRR